MITHLTDFPDSVIAVRCTSRVTKEDYDSVLVPAVQEVLRTHENARVYYEIDDGFTGFEPGAMWEDLKVGLGHFSRWDRIAIVTDIEWIKAAVRFFAFLFPATTRLFSRAEAAQARAWISA